MYVFYPTDILRNIIWYTNIMVSRCCVVRVSVPVLCQWPGGVHSSVSAGSGLLRRHRPQPGLPADDRQERCVLGSRQNTKNICKIDKTYRVLILKVTTGCSCKTNGSCWRRWVSFNLKWKKTKKQCRLTSAVSLLALTVALVSHSQVGQRKALGAHHVQDPRVHRGGEDGPLRSDAGEGRLPGGTPPYLLLTHGSLWTFAKAAQHRRGAIKRGAVLSRPSCWRCTAEPRSRKEPWLASPAGSTSRQCGKMSFLYPHHTRCMMK